MGITTLFDCAVTYRDLPPGPGADLTVGSEAHGLVVEDRDLSVDVLTHEHLHDGALDLAEEAASVSQVLRHDHKAVVVQHEAVHLFRLARFAILVIRTALQSNTSNSFLIHIFLFIYFIHFCFDHLLYLGLRCQLESLCHAGYTYQLRRRSGGDVGEEGVQGGVLHLEANHCRRCAGMFVLVVVEDRVAGRHQGAVLVTWKGTGFIVWQVPKA